MSITATVTAGRMAQRAESPHNLLQIVPPRAAMLRSTLEVRCGAGILCPNKKTSTRQQHVD